MDFSLDLGIFFAVLSAVVTNLAYFFKHRGAATAPPVDVRHPVASALGLFRSRWFMIGWLVALVAWIFHVLALALAPLSVVQVVLASGLVLLAVMADRLFGFTIGKRQWAGLITMAVGLGLVAVTQPAVEGAHSTYSMTAMVAFEVVLLGTAALLIVGPRVVRASARKQGLALGAAAGVLFGVSGVALKALLGLLGTDGLPGLVSPLLLVAALSSVSAFYASARALQVGDAVPVIAITGTAANIMGIAGGIIVYGDPLPGDTVGVVAQVIGFVLIVVAAALTPAPRVKDAPVKTPRAKAAPRPLAA